MKRFSLSSAILAGILGTFAMTALMYMAPLMGLPKMDLIGALGQALPFGLPDYVTGGVIHFGIGIALAIIYAIAFATWLPGPRFVKGALYSILPWIFAITALAPILTLLHSLLPATASAPALNPCSAVANPCAAVVAANPCGAVAPTAEAATSATFLAMMSLVAHLLYGVVVGAVYHAKDEAWGPHPTQIESKASA